jgi:hypothetical protein
VGRTRGSAVASSSGRRSSPRAGAGANFTRHQKYDHVTSGRHFGISIRSPARKIHQPYVASEITEYKDDLIGRRNGRGTGGDIWIAGCSERNPNCPERVGPDDDFGGAAVLAALPNGRDALMAIQKSGVGYALDPDNDGKIIWQYRFGEVKTIGAAQWGVAVD